VTAVEATATVRAVTVADAAMTNEAVMVAWE